MNRTIELSLERAEGAIVRAIGLIERRGFAVTSISTTAEGAPEMLGLRLEVASRGRPFEVLIRQIEKLFDVRSARLVERVTEADPARIAC
jgi:acetolactate synthase regulatory subunit